MGRSKSTKDGDIPASRFATRSSFGEEPARVTFRNQSVNALFAPAQAKTFQAEGRTRSQPAARTSSPRSPAPKTAVQQIEPPVRQGSDRIIGSAREIGQLLKERRKQLGFNQQKLADLSGVGRRFISELEAGKPSLEFDRVLQCCKAIGIDLIARQRS